MASRGRNTRPSGSIGKHQMPKGGTYTKKATGTGSKMESQHGGGSKRWKSSDMRGVG